MNANRALTKKGERDYVLIKKIVEQNDHQAFTKLFNYYYKPVYYMLLKMAHNELDAEDLTIEAFEKASVCLKNYVPDYAFSTWLFKIATNNCIDYMRKKSQNVVRLDIEDGFNRSAAERKMIPENKTPEERMIKKQRAEVLKKAVAKISPNYRKVIELKYLKEYSLKEMADMLHLPIGTIKAQLFRGREMLYDTLVEHKEAF